ncbi:MAG TPA: hypothetical protein VEH76_08415 [Methylocystis sp.]|nr:hypothetical protein [Methylocystis sp.]
MSDVITSAADHEAARRRLRFSLFVVIAAAFGAFVLGFTMPVGPVKKAAISESPEVFVGRLVVLGK